MALEIIKIEAIEGQHYFKIEKFNHQYRLSIDKHEIKIDDTKMLKGLRDFLEGINIV